MLSRFRDGFPVAHEGDDGRPRDPAPKELTRDDLGPGMTEFAPEPSWTLAELEEEGARHVTDAIWAYIQGGAGAEHTVRENAAAFGRWSLCPRAFVDVQEIDLRTEILGRRVAVPFFVAPMAYQGQVHPDGERAVARAAGRENVLAAYSTLSSCSLEEIARDSGDGPRWFQLYLQPDFEVSRSLIERAERAGFDALVLTADAPVLGVRDRQARGGFAIDASVPLGNGRDVVPPPQGPAAQGPVYRLRSDAGATWEVVGAIRSITRLPVIVKGILSVDDARRAARAGAAGLLLSNHGGRQLDRSVSPLSVLPEIRKEVPGTLEVYLDGGVRRASEILISLALGARAVGIGRPFLWALAAAGSTGVRRYLRLLSEELATGLAIAGRRNLGEVGPDLVREIRS